MNELRVASMNTAAVFEHPERVDDQQHILKELEKLGAQVVFLVEAGYGGASSALAEPLKQYGYQIRTANRVQHREDDVHAVSRGVDIHNLIAWRDGVSMPDVVKLGRRTGFMYSAYGLPGMATHFDDWQSQSRHEMLEAALDHLGRGRDGPSGIIKGDFNSSDPRVRTFAQYLFSRDSYNRAATLAARHAPEKLERPANIARRLGEIASDTIIQRFAEHGFHSMLPAEATFDGRSAGGFGRHFALGVDNILGRNTDNSFHVVSSFVRSRRRQHLDHSLVSAEIAVADLEV